MMLKDSVVRICSRWWRWWSFWSVLPWFHSSPFHVKPWVGMMVTCSNLLSFPKSKAIARHFFFSFCTFWRCRMENSICCNNVRHGSWCWFLKMDIGHLWIHCAFWKWWNTKKAVCIAGHDGWYDVYTNKTPPCSPFHQTPKANKSWRYVEHLFHPWHSSPW